MLHPLRKIDTEDALWRVYWHGRGELAFNRLTNFYMPWVKNLAFMQSQKLPYQCDWQDCFQDGSIALLDCIQRYDKNHGSRFKTFATRRILGAFQDGLRHMDWVPRLVRMRREPVVAMRQFAQTRPSTTVNENKEPEDDIGRDQRGRSIDVSLSRLELRDEVRRALRGLRKQERLAVVLYYLEGMTMNEIGESLVSRNPESAR